ncbi:MAG: 50S ribosomal protein L9 [Actinomycetes bacterium]|nr:50S ribosomal protein L9 [Solirubrobacterales bacterium]
MPQAILLKDVETLGEKGDVVIVSKGYMRNFLAPRNLAREATDAAIEESKRRAIEQEREQRESIERAGEHAALLSKTVLTIPRKAGDDGRLFGSVTSADVAEAIREARGIKVDKRKIRLEDPIKEIGTHMVEVEIPGGKIAAVKTMIVAES